MELKIMKKKIWKGDNFKENVGVDKEEDLG